MVLLWVDPLERVTGTSCLSAPGVQRPLFENCYFRENCHWIAAGTVVFPNLHWPDLRTLFNDKFKILPSKLRDSISFQKIYFKIYKRILWNKCYVSSHLKQVYNFPLRQPHTVVCRRVVSLLSFLLRTLNSFDTSHLVILLNKNKLKYSTNWSYYKIAEITYIRDHG